MQVSVTKREAEIKLDNKDFDERATNYRRKRWIEDGLDPDVMELNMQKEKQDRIAEFRKNAKQKRIDLKISDQAKVEKYKSDDRFQGVQMKTIEKKNKAQQKTIQKLKRPLKAQKTSKG